MKGALYLKAQLLSGLLPQQSIQIIKTESGLKLLARTQIGESGFEVV